jgi:murein DD-endopeptidase MepM/ murein hydrolase activator NlpD
VPLRRAARGVRLGGLRPPRRPVRRAVRLVAAALALACATPQEAVHVVQPGENVYRIAAWYRVPVSDIVEANDIRDVHDLQPGTALRIPGAERPPPHEALRPPGTLVDPERSPLYERPEAWVVPRSTPELRAEALAEARRAGQRFAWPLRGVVTSRYGRRGRHLHAGIDIGARKGTRVHAAEAGQVLFSGRMGSYGNVVVVGHGGAFRTLYAHNRRNRVRAGERVERGDVIAEVGSTGNATGPHLHFEIRLHDLPRDPLLFLPVGFDP